MARADFLREETVVGSGFMWRFDMDDMPITRQRFGAKARSEPCDTGFGPHDRKSKIGPAEAAWTEKQLQDVFDGVASGPPTLRERLENWGSD